MSHQVENSARPKRWVATKEGPLLWRNWNDDEYIVYSTASGDTHLINEVTAEVLRQLERCEQSLSDLTRNVANSLGAETDRQTETYIAGLLDHLDRIGLVESDP